MSCSDKSMLVTTKIFCRDKHNFAVTKLLSRQAYFCRDKHNFVATSIFLSRQKTCLSRQKTCLSRQNVLRDKNDILWQLSPMIKKIYLFVFIVRWGKSFISPTVQLKWRSKCKTYLTPHDYSQLSLGVKVRTWIVAHSRAQYSILTACMHGKVYENQELHWQWKTKRCSSGWTLGIISSSYN